MNEYSDVEKEVILQAKKKALRLLEFSDRTEKQLRDKLEEGEFPPFAIDEAVEYARSFHYIDDSRYAEHYIRAKASGKSLFQLKHELQEKGVSQGLIDTAVDKALKEGELDEEEAVKALFIKKYGRKDLSEEGIYQKAFRYFAGKGYGFDVIKSGITRAIESLEEESGEF